VPRDEFPDAERLFLNVNSPDELARAQALSAASA
jgi:hypothetical protein